MAGSGCTAQSRPRPEARQRRGNDCRAWTGVGRVDCDRGEVQRIGGWLQGEEAMRRHGGDSASNGDGGRWRRLVESGRCGDDNCARQQLRVRRRYGQVSWWRSRGCLHAVGEGTVVTLAQEGFLGRGPGMPSWRGAVGMRCSGHKHCWQSCWWRWRRRPRASLSLLGASSWSSIPTTRGSIGENPIQILDE